MTDWAELLRLHGPAVWRTVYRVLGHHADAADCYQDTFLAAVELAKSETVENWGAALTCLATRRAIDRLRQRGRARQRLGTGNLVDVPARDGGPVAALAAAELTGRLRDALAGLPEKQAEVFWLRAVEDLSYREIADQLGLGTNEVGVLLHRARARLREIFPASEERVSS